MEKEEIIEAIKLVAQQMEGSNTIKDSIALLKLMSKRQQELYEDDFDINTLAVCNTEMLSIVVDVLEKLLKNE